MREKVLGCWCGSLEGVEHPPRRASPGGTCMRRQQRVRKSSPSPHTNRPPTSLTCRPAGPCNLHIFYAGLQGRKFRGLQLQRLLSSLVSLACCKPQKGKKTELRPDLPMLTNINYHGCGVRGYGGMEEFGARVHWLITGLEGVISRERQTGTPTPTHTHTDANNKQGGRSEWRPVVAMDKAWAGRHRGQIVPRFVPDCKVLSMPRGRSGRLPGGELPR